MVPFGKRWKMLPAVLSGEGSGESALVCEVSQGSNVSKQPVADQSGVQSRYDGNNRDGDCAGACLSEGFGHLV